MSSGYIYIATNDSQRGLLKIGITTRSVAQRMKELSDKSSVPVKFSCAYSKRVERPTEIESRVHSLLDSHRVNDGREFFNCDLQVAIRCIESVISGQPFDPYQEQQRETFVQKLYQANSRWNDAILKLRQNADNIAISIHKIAQLILNRKAILVMALVVASSIVSLSSYILLNRKLWNPTYYDFGQGMVLAHQHKNGGGWVANSASIEESVYISSESKVYGSPILTGMTELRGPVEVRDSSQVRNSLLRGKIKVSDSAIVESSDLVGNISIKDFASVQGDKSTKITIVGDVLISDYSNVSCSKLYCPKISGEISISQYSKVKGNVEIDQVKKSFLKDNTRIESVSASAVAKLSGEIQSEGNVVIFAGVTGEGEMSKYKESINLNSGKLAVKGTLEFAGGLGLRVSGDSSMEGTIAFESGVIDNSKVFGKVEIKSYSEILDSSIEGESSIGAILSFTRIKKSKIVDSKILESQIERSVVHNSTVCLSISKDSELSNKVFRGDPVKFYDGDAEVYFSEQSILSERCELVRNPNYKEKPKSEEAEAVESSKKA